MVSSDFVQLFGSQAGEGAQTNLRQVWWLCYAGPSGEEADNQRRRMLSAFRTMPHPARTAFLTRLHSVKAIDAFGAITELEYVALLESSGVPFSWVDPMVASNARQRNVDFMLPNGLYAEVTTLTEPAVPPQAQELFRALSRDTLLPPGVYAMTVGEGAAPMRQLRAGIRKALSDGQLVLSRHEDWELRYVDAVSESPLEVQQTAQEAKLLVLYDRLDRTLQAKRKQGREANVQDFTIGVVVLDRLGAALMDRLISQPHERLGRLFAGSGSDGCVVHAVAIGVAPPDVWPPVPKWTVFSFTNDPIVAALRARHVQLPLVNSPHRSALEPRPHDLPLRLTYHLTVTVVPAADVPPTPQNPADRAH